MSHVTTSPSHLQQQQMLPLLWRGLRFFFSFVCVKFYMATSHVVLVT
jgi:hypothetical protein